MESKPSANAFLRFALVGLLNTAFSYVVYAALLYVGFGYVLANFGAVALGILFSFRTQGALVFGNRGWRPFLRFLPVWACIYLFNIGVIAVLLRGGLNAYVAGAVAIVPVAVLSYLLQKHYVFHPGRLSPATGADPRH